MGNSADHQPTTSIQAVTSIRAADRDGDTQLRATDSRARRCLAMCSERRCMKRIASSPQARVGEWMRRGQSKQRISSGDAIGSALGGSSFLDG
eukprot:1878098-Amphidinium_carterae.1